MELSSALRDGFWASSDWNKHALELAREAERVADPWDRSFRVFELGQLCEHLVPDRDRALVLYKQAWLATEQNRRALIRARFLYRELGRLDMVAQLAGIEHKHTRDADALVMAGMAWLDFGDFSQAASALKKVSRIENVALHEAHEVANGGTHEAENRAIEMEVAAERSGDSTLAADRYLLSVALMRTVDPVHPDIELHLRAALKRDPRHERAFTLLELLLEKASRWDEYTVLFQMRAEASKTDYERVEMYRRAGTNLAVRFGESDRGARMMRSALAIAYDAGLDEIPGHLALIDALRRVAPVQQFVAICKRALAAPFSEDEKLFIAALAGSSAWRTLQDPTLAQELISRVKGIHNSHPLVVEFEKEHGNVLPIHAGAAEHTHEMDIRVDETLTGAATAAGFIQAAEPKTAARFMTTDVRSMVLWTSTGHIDVAGVRFDAETRVLSATSLYVMTGQSVAVGAAVSVRLQLPRPSDQAPHEYAVQGVIALVEPGAGIAIDLTDPPAAFHDALAALRSAK